MIQHDFVHNNGGKIRKSIVLRNLRRKQDGSLQDFYVNGGAGVTGEAGYI